MSGKRPSGDHFLPPHSCSFDPDAFDDLRRRASSIDGNGMDPTGGRMGRVERDIVNMRADMTYSNRLLITTLLASLGTLITAIIGVAIVVKR